MFWSVAEPSCAQGYSYGSLIASLHPVLPEPITTAHILISYPLDKRGLLTLFHSNTYISGLSNLTRDPHSHVLLAFGDHDEFTSIDSYEDWIEKIKNTDTEIHSGPEVVIVEKASHFWRANSLDILSEKVGRWLDIL